MSKYIDYEICKSDIMTLVKKNSHYEAQKSAADGSTFEQYATITANEEILDDYLEKGVLALVGSMGKWLVMSPVEGGKVNDPMAFNLRLPNGADIVQTDSLENLSKVYLVACVLSQWFALCKNAELTTLYEKEAESFMERIQSAINSRTRIRRSRHNCL